MYTYCEIAHKYTQNWWNYYCGKKIN